MIVIGLTGGIASGKSTVTQFFREHDVPVIDADLLGHKTYEPGTPTFKQVVEAFGDDLVAEDGTIDRKVLGGKVFGKPEELKRLTDIVWPGIRALASEEIEGYRGARPADCRT
ncbi:MAG: dephospho-CoA kinase [Dehalococcoidia bacterium]|nr:dephospho-CoA kinase [Dehalococcoidia bacterium]